MCNYRVYNNKKQGNIKAQGKTVIVAEHRLYYLTGIADKIVYMEKGEIAGIFTPGDFKSLSPETRHCMGLRAPDLSEVRPDCALDTAAVQNRTASAPDKAAHTSAQGAHERLELEVKNVSLYRKKSLFCKTFLFPPAQAKLSQLRAQTVPEKQPLYAHCAACTKKRPAVFYGTETRLNRKSV